MPLTSLFLEECPIADLRPLQGMNLTEVSLSSRPVYKEGMDVLRQMSSLKTIDIVYGRRCSAADFWKRLDAGEFTK